MRSTRYFTRTALLLVTGDADGLHTTGPSGSVGVTACLHRLRQSPPATSTDA